MKVKGGFDLTQNFEGLFSSSPSSFSLSKRMFQARCKIWASLLPHPEPPPCLPNTVEIKKIPRRDFSETGKQGEGGRAGEDGDGERRILK